MEENVHKWALNEFSEVHSANHYQEFNFITGVLYAQTITLSYCEDQ